MAAPVPTSVTNETPSSSGTAKPTTKKNPPKAAPTNPAPLLYQPYPLANEWGFQNAVPVSQPVSNGYDIAATRIGRARRAAALNSANAILTSPIGGAQYQMSLFITDVNLDSALAGTTAQARLTRDFYPHNFVQATIQCLGLSLDQEDYGLLCEFVHAAQHHAISNGQNGLTQLFVAGRHNPSPFGTAFNRGFNGNRPHRGNRNVSVSGASSGAQNGTWWNQALHGTHSPILAQGYVNSMPREHQQFEYVVQWELDFTVSVMLDGIYKDANFNAASLLQDSNTALMNGVQNDALAITAALQKQNKAALAYAAKNATSFFPASQTNFGNAPVSGPGGGVVPPPPTGATITMYDTSETNNTAGSIPISNPQAVAGYVDGNPNLDSYNNLVAAFPKANHLSICVRASDSADCLDIEPGNASPSDAGPWAKRMISQGASRPCLYADESDMPAVKASLRAAGLNSNQYRLWLATDSGSPGVRNGYDATQWKFAGAYDQSSCLSNFFE